MPTDPWVHGVDHQWVSPGNRTLSLFQNKHGAGELKDSFRKDSVMVPFVST